MKTSQPDNTPRLCQPGKASDDVDIDPEFASLIPPLASGELNELHRSLDAQGCRDPLIVWQDRDILVDGHNRIRYCREKGYSFPVVEQEFAGREEVRKFIIQNQLARRNLSPAAESYLRGKRYLELKQKRGRVPDHVKKAQPAGRKTSQQLAEEFSVGEKTIRRDSLVALAADVIAEQCGDDARPLMLTRESGMTRAGIVRLADQPPAEQRKFIEQLRLTGHVPRRERKPKRRDHLTLPIEPKALVEALLENLDIKALAAVSKALTKALDEQRDKS